MSEGKHTQGLIEVSTELPYIVAVTSPQYCIRKGMVISRGMKTGGQNWPAILPEERIANAARFVKCWNSHDALLEACRLALNLHYPDEELTKSTIDIKCKKMLQAVIALAEKGE